MSSILAALKDGVCVNMHCAKQIHLLEVRDSGQPSAGTNSLKIVSLNVENSAYMLFFHFKTSPNWAHEKDPLLPTVSFIAGRYSLRATERGSYIARRALSMLKGLSLSSLPREKIAEGSDMDLSDVSGH